MSGNTPDGPHAPGDTSRTGAVRPRPYDQQDSRTPYNRDRPPLSPREEAVIQRAARRVQAFRNRARDRQPMEGPTAAEVVDEALGRTPDGFTDRHWTLYRKVMLGS